MFEREKAAWIDVILSGKGISSGWVLEYGCGTAGMSVYLANQGFQAVATDISMDALVLANMNFRENGCHNGKSNFFISAADVCRLPFQDDIFDISMSHGLLEHFRQDVLPLVLQEAVRILKPGGLFLADISHGRFSARKVARWLNFPVSLVYYLCRGEFVKLRKFLSACFDLYENRLDPHQWKQTLEGAGLTDVQVKVLRPFPPFSLTPALDRQYVALMTKLLPLWHRFDRSQSWFTQRWGWLYLAYGIKP